MASHRILYVGQDLPLLNFLKHALQDCHIVRYPGVGAHTLIESRINYSLLLFDAERPGVSVPELAHFTRSLTHRERTPLIIRRDSDDFNSLTEAITLALQQHSSD